MRNWLPQLARQLVTRATPPAPKLKLDCVAESNQPQMKRCIIGTIGVTGVPSASILAGCPTLNRRAIRRPG